ncbi:MAG: phosphotransferase [Pseudomonadota bacterium]
MTRDETRSQFLLAAGIRPDRATPLAGDASNRRYLRIADTQQILMDAPPERGEDVRPFVAVTNWLREHGFSAPRIDSEDLEHGFLLLEDLGDRLYRDVCAKTPSDEEHLYSQAIDVLAAIGRVPVPQALPLGAEHLALASYDETVLLREARLAIDWYRAGVLGDQVSLDLIDAFNEVIASAMIPVADTRQVVVLRDYHAENLIWLPERTSNGRVGLLDYQDALGGHPAYDLVSLLEDARRDTSEALREAMLSRYTDQASADPAAFRLDYACLGAQRNLKIIGIFARLAMRDGKGHYPALIPRVWAHLQRDLAHPALRTLRDFVAEHLPEPDASALDKLRLAAKRPVGWTA